MICKSKVLFSVTELKEDRRIQTKSIKGRIPSKTEIKLITRAKTSSSLMRFHWLVLLMAEDYLLRSLKKKISRLKKRVTTQLYNSLSLSLSCFRLKIEIRMTTQA